MDRVEAGGDWREQIMPLYFLAIVEKEEMIKCDRARRVKAQAKPAGAYSCGLPQLEVA